MLGAVIHAGLHQQADADHVLQEAGMTFCSQHVKSVYFSWTFKLLDNLILTNTASLDHSKFPVTTFKLSVSSICLQCLMLFSLPCSLSTFPNPHLTPLNLVLRVVFAELPLVTLFCLLNLWISLLHSLLAATDTRHLDRPMNEKHKDLHLHGP